MDFTKDDRDTCTLMGVFESEMLAAEMLAEEKGRAEVIAAHRAAIISGRRIPTRMRWDSRFGEDK